MKYSEQRKRKRQAEEAKEAAIEFLKLPRRSIWIDEKTQILHRDLTTDPAILRQRWIDQMESFRYLAEKKRGNNVF